MTQISACQSCRRASAAGFTLLEILVVLFIVAILTGITVVNMPSQLGGSDFEHETERLRIVIRQLREEALLQASEFGLEVHRGGYRFHRYDDASQRWLAYEERPFHAYRWPEGMVGTLKVDAEEVGLQGSDTSEPPAVLILSSGEITPFTLALRSNSSEQPRVLESDGFSALRWQGEAQ